MPLKRKKADADIPTASLPDIVFMLLIFFLVTTTIDMDKGILMTLPDRGGQFKVNPENICNILVNQAGDILVDDDPANLSTLNETIRKKVQERGLDADGKPRLIVSIKTERATAYDVYISVLDEVKRSGATKISIAEPEN